MFSSHHLLGALSTCVDGNGRYLTWVGSMMAALSVVTLSGLLRSYIRSSEEPTLEARFGAPYRIYCREIHLASQEVSLAASLLLPCSFPLLLRLSGCRFQRCLRLMEVVQFVHPDGNRICFPIQILYPF